MWWINQGAHSYNVWTYHFPSVSTSLQAYSLLSETICLCCVDTSSVVVVSTDAFQVMTDCWHAHAGSHIITRPQTQTRFLSHMYTNFYIHSPAHTGRHPCQTVPAAVEIWSTFSRRGPCPQGGIHFKCSRPHWFWAASRANSCVLFISEW